MLIFSSVTYVAKEYEENHKSVVPAPLAIEPVMIGNENEDK